MWVCVCNWILRSFILGWRVNRKGWSPQTISFSARNAPLFSSVQQRHRLTAEKQIEDRKFQLKQNFCRQQERFCTELYRTVVTKCFILKEKRKREIKAGSEIYKTFESFAAPKLENINRWFVNSCTAGLKVHIYYTDNMRLCVWLWNQWKKCR